MFDLEKALAAWRRSLTFNRNFQPEDVDELERHLRDQVRDLVSDGMTEEEAFRTARAHFGQYGDVEREYRKVRWESLSARGRTMEELGARWAMLVSYVFLALRSFRRHPLYFGLNLGGLTIGMAAALLIMLFIQHERSYDSFHEGADRIYRVVNASLTTYTSALLAPTLAAEYSEIETTTRISQRWNEVRVTNGGQVGMESKFFFADSTFFDVFSFPLIAGNPAEVLDSPFSIVLTESTARTYFGDEDPIGQLLQIRGFETEYDFAVTGVAADMRGDSHFQFDLLASYSSRYRTNEPHSSIDTWGTVGDRTYIKLSSSSFIESISSAIPDFGERHFPEIIERRGEEAGPMFSFQPIKDIHLRSDLPNEFIGNGDPGVSFPVFRGAQK